MHALMGARERVGALDLQCRAVDRRAVVLNVAVTTEAASEHDTIEVRFMKLGRSLIAKSKC